ncbi:hypothetical protein LINPERHAP1_LOCUS1710 [Linum perenne]
MKQQCDDRIAGDPERSLSIERRMISEDLALASYTDADINHAFAKMESSNKKKNKVPAAETTKKRPVLVSSPQKSGQKRRRLTKGGQLVRGARGEQPLQKREAPRNVVPISQEMPEKSPMQEVSRKEESKKEESRKEVPRKKLQRKEVARPEVPMQEEQRKEDNVKEGGDTSGNAKEHGKGGDKEGAVQGEILDFTLAADIGKSMVERTADEEQESSSQQQDDLPISLLLEDKLKTSDKGSKSKKLRSASKRTKNKSKYVKSPYEAQKYTRIKCKSSATVNEGGEHAPEGLQLIEYSPGPVTQEMVEIVDKIDAYNTDVYADSERCQALTMYMWNDDFDQGEVLFYTEYDIGRLSREEFMTCRPGFMLSNFFIDTYEQCTNILFKQSGFCDRFIFGTHCAVSVLVLVLFS